MPGNRFDWLERIKSVEREHRAARLAVRRLSDQAGLDPSVLELPRDRDHEARSLGRAIAFRDLILTSDQLEGTYLIRLFAEFESGLRAYWEVFKKTTPKTENLLKGVAAKCKVPPDRATEAQEVREYRNSLVHMRSRQATAIPIDRARGHLCSFLSFLPKTW
jgi:hypothetical protein